MGVKFRRMKVHASSDPKVPSTVAVWEDATHPALLPIHGITRLVDEGRANKVNVPYVTTSGTGTTVVNYKTVWVPIGQEGWSIKIQTTLKYQEITDGTDVDEIKNWLTVDSAQILAVESNQVNTLGEHDTTIAAYDRLEPETLWYVDKILIQSRIGVVQLADMEMTLIRCWQYPNTAVD